MAGKPRVFISYARADGERFASDLLGRLKRVLPQFDFWQDRSAMQGGVPWWAQIAGAIEDAHALILVLTPAAMRSASVEAEWTYARQRGVYVCPVKGASDDALKALFPQLPRWMKKRHSHDIEAEWDGFLADLKSPPREARVVFMAPPPPEGYVERKAEFNKLRDYLLAEGSDKRVAISTAVQGAGGFGKTTLAKALCQDGDVCKQFDDGILWVQLGQQPNLLTKMADLYRILTGEPLGVSEERAAAVEIAKLFVKNRDCLLVVDDVWNIAHLKPFLEAAQHLRLLFTTRQFEIAAQAQAVNVDGMQTGEAAQMLAALVQPRPQDLAPFRALAQRLGEWPLLLELARSYLRKRIRKGATLAGALAEVNKAYDQYGVKAFDQRDAIERNQALGNSMEATLQLLEPAERRRYAELAIFPEDTDIPISAAAALWATTEDEADRILDVLSDLSLLKFNADAHVARLHDVMRKYLAEGLAEPASLHQMLLDTWGDPHHLLDDYAWRWYAWHLKQAGREKALRKLLLDFNWLQAKLDATDVIALISDYDHLFVPVGSPDKAATLPGEPVRALFDGPLDDEKKAPIQLVRDAIRLSSRAITEEAGQLPTQLLGRLGGSTNAQLRCLLDDIAAWHGSTWLRPLFPDTLAVLTKPGGALICCLGSHAQGVNSVAVLDDGSLAVSGAKDGSVCIWDLKLLKGVHTLLGHTDEVNAVLISQIDGGPIAVSGSGKRLPFKSAIQFRSFVERTDTRPSNDNTVRIWDLAGGRLRATLEGHTAAVRCLASCGRLLLSGSDDGTIRMWDLQEGKSLGVLGSQGAPVVLLGIIPNRLAVVAFSEYDFQLWHILERRGQRKDKFDYLWQNAVAVDPARLLVALQDTTISGDEFRLKVWDILDSQDGRENIETVASFKTSFNAAHFLADGKRILVGGTDQMIRLIDIASSEELHHYEGHKAEVTSIALAKTAGRFISSASDGNVLYWDLTRVTRADRQIGHSDDVNSVAVSRAGNVAVSASYDRSVIVWDTRTGNPMRTFCGHRLSVICTAIDNKGTKVLSGSNDCTVRLWSLKGDDQMLELTGHKSSITGVAFCKDETRAVSVSFDKSLKVWDLNSGCESCTMEGHQYGIKALALFHCDDLAVTGDESGRLIFWDLAKGKERKRLDRYCDLPKLEQSTTALWEVARGPEWKPSPEEAHAPCIESLAISPDDRWLIVAQRNKPIAVWGIDRELEVLTLRGHKGIVFGVAVTCHGRRLISASDDNSLRVWDLATRACVAAFTADFPLYCCSASPDGRAIVAGEGARSGKVQFLTLVEDGNRHGL